MKKAVSTTRMQELYEKSIRKELKDKFGFTNPMQIPRLTKIVVNMGVGRATEDKKVLDAAVSDMGLITGQRPCVTRARKAIATYKIRKDMPLGCRVTLRGERMYEFLDRLVTIALPRVRDFDGIPTRSFDGSGNYSLGVKEQIIFPEIDYDKTDTVRGMDITICTTARNDDETRALLDGFGMPFRKRITATANTAKGA